MKRLFLVLVLLLACVGIVSADTLIVYTTNATDGNIYRVGANQTFIGIRDSPGTSFDTTGATTAAYIRSDLTTNTYDRLYRTALIYDTSAIPDTATLNSALVGLYRFNGYTTLADTGLNIVKFNIDGTISADDYDNFEVSRFSTDQNASTITTAKYYNFSLNALGIENISKTGNTGLGSRFGFDIDNISPTWASGGGKISGAAWRPADYVLYPPFLQIEYTPADTTPPQAITNLANGTYDCSDGHVDISWDNPTDTDYYRLNAYINETLTYYGNTTDSVTLTGLPENTAMTFNTATEDLAGNINNTHWQNLTFTTGSCAAPPVSNISCYFTNITGVSLGWNTSEWNITQGQWTWGTWITNVTQGNISYYSCYDAISTPTSTPTPTITPTWTPEINPPSPDSLIGTIKGWIKKFLKDVLT